MGVLLLLLAVKRWRDRPRAGETAEPLAWMSAIDTLTARRAAVLALACFVVNPKNLTPLPENGWTQSLRRGRRPAA